MISPDFRKTEIPAVIDAYKLYITQNHGKPTHPVSKLTGDSMWKDLEMEFQRVFSARKEICSIGAYRSDPEQLKKFKAIFLEIYQTQTLFNKYFTYGNQKVSTPALTISVTIESSQHHPHLVRLVHEPEEAVGEADVRRHIFPVQLRRRLLPNRKHLGRRHIFIRILIN